MKGSYILLVELNDNKTEFVSRVMLTDRELGTGTGFSKKDAEQKAAEQALENLMVPTRD